MFFQQKKPASQGRENLFTTANKLFLTASRPRNQLRVQALKNVPLLCLAVRCVGARYMRIARSRFCGTLLSVNTSTL